MTPTTPKDTVLAWVEAFNAEDLDRLADLYAEDAVNHQVVREPVIGRAAIRDMFAEDFAAAEMTCLVEQVIEGSGAHADWAVLEWRDPNGLRGCGFFQVREGRIVFQRGYFDQLTFVEAQKAMKG